MSTYDEFYFTEEQMLLNPTFVKAIGIIFLIVLGVIMSEYYKAQKFNKKRKGEFYNNSTAFTAKFSRRNEILGVIYLMIAGLSWVVLYNANESSVILESSEVSDDVIASIVPQVVVGLMVFIVSGVSACVRIHKEILMQYRTLFVTDDTIYLSVCKERGNPIVVKKELTGIKDVVALKNRTGFELFPVESLQIRTESAIYEVEGIVDAPQVQYLIERRQHDIMNVR